MDLEGGDCCRMQWTLGQSSPFSIYNPVKNKESFGKLYSRRSFLSVSCPWKKRELQATGQHLPLSPDFPPLTLLVFVLYFSCNEPFHSACHLLALKCFLSSSPMCRKMALGRRGLTPGLKRFAGVRASIRVLSEWR